MSINNVNLKYLENHFLPRMTGQYTSTESGNRDPVSNAVNTAIISSICATISNIFQFIIPRGIPSVAIGVPSFAFLAQNITLGAFSIVLGVFALGRFKQSMTLAEERCEEDTKILSNREKWGASLQGNLKADILEAAQLQSNIDSKNLQFVKDNLICFVLGMGLITANAIFASLSLEILALATVCVMLGTLIFFAYNLGNHWDDNLINKKRIEALHVNDLIKELHKINSPEDAAKKPTKRNITFQLDSNSEDIGKPSACPVYHISASA